MPVAKAPVWEFLEPRNRQFGPEGESSGNLEHWRYARDGNDVIWLILDRAGDSANTLSEAVIRELDTVLGEIEGSGARGLVIRSAKPGGFAVGADIRDFRGVDDAEQIEQRMLQAHAVIDRLERLKMPSVAIIHGHCLGGGLEIALACRYRLAISGASLGFPEILLGLHPGLGGTFRLTGLIDPVEAMTMMLTGRSVHAGKAKKLGLVDGVIEERHVANAVEAAVSGRLAQGGPGWKARAFGLAPARRMAARRMRSEAEKRAPKRHYPAPYQLIDLWEEHGGDRAGMQKGEISSFSKLLAGETAQNLIRVFFLREGLRAHAKGDSGIERVHVIGAGTMGGDIAAWCAVRGLKVSLADLDPKVLARAIGRASAFFDKKLHSSIERRDALDRLMPDFDGAGVARADLVIEAVAERADVKKKVYQSILPRMKKDAILATNTSSIPLETLREGLSASERLVGLHFFNPVTRMELVEIVSHDQAAAKTLKRAYAFCGEISRLPAPVKSAPGFLVNRALMPYLVEAFLMIEEGTAKEEVDRAAERFGMPMGPVELADRVGLDICLEVARMLGERLEGQMPPVPAWLARHVEAGETGRKAGKGLYAYDDKGKPRKQPITNEDDETRSREMADRLVLPILNTLVRCLREGVVQDAETADAAMIFGTGFAPFRGGPLHYARQRGVDDVKAALQRLRNKHGERFEPDAGWDKLK